MDVLLLLAVIATVAVLVAAAAHNGLASLRQAVRDGWAAMDVELHHRYDLLVPLASAVRQSGEPTPPGLAAALAAKNRAAIAFNPAQLAVAEADLTAGLHAFFATPPAALTGDTTFARARADLAAAEAAIAAAGRRYNDAVVAYNAALHSFPHAWVARTAGFRPQPTFDATTP